MALKNIADKESKHNQYRKFEMKRFIFDVDGTLTPSRATIDPDFKSFFLDFIKNNKVWLVTGSDYSKTVEQLGPEICENVATVYNCSGNDVWFEGKRVNAKEFTLPPDLKEYLDGMLQRSKFHLRTGTHIESRRGLVNFSIIGRGANAFERKEYVAWDEVTDERIGIAAVINRGWPDIHASVGGETGIDIHRRGCDKSQILEDFDLDDEIHFFGDAMDPGGNDFPLKIALNEKMSHTTSYHVKNWEETYYYLKKMVDTPVIA